MRMTACQTLAPPQARKSLGQRSPQGLQKRLAGASPQAFLLGREEPRRAHPCLVLGSDGCAVPGWRVCVAEPAADQEYAGALKGLAFAEVPPSCTSSAPARGLNALLAACMPQPWSSLTSLVNTPQGTRGGMRSAVRGPGRAAVWSNDGGGAAAEQHSTAGARGKQLVCCLASTSCVGAY